MLKRQNRKKQFASFGFKTGLVILLLNEILFIFVTQSVKHLAGLDESNTGLVLYILTSMCFGMLTLSLPWFVGAFIMVRLRDYMVLYQSYDDNSVVDKVARLMNTVGRAILDGLHSTCVLPFCGLGLIKPDKVISNASVETEL